MNKCIKEVGESYDNLKRSVELFQKQMRRVALNIQSRKIKDSTQVTIHDTFRQKWIFLEVLCFLL
jgi:hypothetical protein